MGIMHYLTHEYGEKWSIVWRSIAIMSIASFAILLPATMITTPNQINLVIGSVLIALIILIAYGSLLKAILNVVVRKYIPGFKINFKQALVKVLALISLTSIIILIMQATLVSLVYITSIASMILISVMALIFAVIVVTFAMGFIIVAYYAVLENLKRQEYGYLITFGTFWKLKNIYLGRAINSGIKLMFLCIIVALIMSLIYILVAFGFASVLTTTESIFTFGIFSVIAWLIIILMYLLLYTVPIQYLTNCYLG